MLQVFLRLVTRYFKCWEGPISLVYIKTIVPIVMTIFVLLAFSGHKSAVTCLVFDAAAVRLISGAKVHNDMTALCATM